MARPRRPFFSSLASLYGFALLLTSDWIFATSPVKSMGFSSNSSQPEASAFSRLFWVGSAVRTIIGISFVLYRKFKPLFFWPKLYSRTRELSISLLFDENRGFASVGSGDAVVGGARSVPGRAARSNSE